MNKSPIPIFVYGTLKSGMKNHNALLNLDATYTASGHTLPRYPMFGLGAGFPYLQDTQGVGEHVQGELWVIPPGTEHCLDEFEGVPTPYKKGLINVIVGHNEYSDIRCYFVTDELSPQELTAIDLLTNWTEN